MRPPPVILSGVHWKTLKCASGVPIVGATALRCGSQLHTTRATPMGAASSARLLTLTIAFASANVGVACGRTKKQTRCQFGGTAYLDLTMSWKSSHRCSGAHPQQTRGSKASRHLVHGRCPSPARLFLRSEIDTFAQHAHDALRGPPVPPLDQGTGGRPP